jgi:hypothetical protein
MAVSLAKPCLSATRLRGRRLASAAFVGAMLLVNGARAELEPRVTPLDTKLDGVYGRFDGDLELSLGAGAQYRAGFVQPGMRLSAHYFSMAGLYFVYADPLSDAEGRGQRHFVAAGVDIKPAFVPRWSLDLGSGTDWLDLLLDSISIGLGAYFIAPGSEQSARGFETSLGFGVPLVVEASGPWLNLRGGLLFADDARQNTLGTAMLTLSWTAYWASPLLTRAP